jgi:AcrR family transcriptional regulator
MILRGAFELARRDGLDALSMPTLAAHLSVGITSIYWYFRSKEELLQQMYLRSAESLEKRVADPIDSDPANWKANLRQLFLRVREAYAEDELIAELQLHPLAGRSGVTRPAAYRRVERTLEVLIAAGFTAPNAWELYSTLVIFTNGTVMAEQARRRTGQPPTGEAQLSQLDVPNMPILADLVRSADASIDMTGSTFAPGIDLILDAAELKLTGGAAAS